MLCAFPPLADGEQALDQCDAESSNVSALIVFIGVMNNHVERQLYKYTIAFEVGDSDFTVRSVPHRLQHSFVVLFIAVPVHYLLGSSGGTTRLLSRKLLTALVETTHKPSMKSNGTVVGNFWRFWFC